MDQLKYSIAVKLVGHDVDTVQGYSVARYLVANEQIGRWLCGILERNDNNWLLGIVLRHPDVSERRSNACLVRCGKCNHIMVTFDNANVPSPGSLMPTISIDLFLAMNHGGNFLDDKFQEFGVIRDGSLFDHIRSGIDSGFNLGDLRVYLHPNIHCVNEVYTDSIEGGRLVRFFLKKGSWTVSRDVLIDDLELYVSSNKAQSRLLKHKNDATVVNDTSSTAAVVDTGNKITAPITMSIEEAKSKRGKKREKKLDKSGKSDVPCTPQNGNQSDIVESSAPASTVANKPTIAASSCFYAPFCKELARDCGGIRKGLCNEVNSGKIKIPSHEVFLEEKRKRKNKLKSDRKAIKTVMPDHYAAEIPVNLKDTSHTESSVLFNPREYILLYKAWNEVLTATDIKDTGETYTEQDCTDAARILNEIASSGMFHIKEQSR